jgi:hypothetical protein
LIEPNRLQEDREAHRNGPFKSASLGKKKKKEEENGSGGKTEDIQHRCT